MSVVDMRFTTAPCIDGYEVVVRDSGRAVAKRATLHSASGTAFKLNNAARYGPKALARAFGKVYEQPAEEG